MDIHAHAKDAKIMYTNMCIHTSLSLYTYIYIYRERERYMCVYLYTCLFVEEFESDKVAGINLKNNTKLKLAFKGGSNIV